MAREGNRDDETRFSTVKAAIVPIGTVNSRKQNFGVRYGSRPQRRGVPPCKPGNATPPVLTAHPVTRKKLRQRVTTLSYEWLAAT